MAPRSTWKGHLKLGMVTCQIRLYPATTESNRVSFHQLHKDTLNRVNMKPFDPEIGVIDRADIVKGYEYERDKHIVVTADDLDTVKIESKHTIDIEAFVNAGEVDALYLDAPYFLAPDGALADDAFLVVREAMKRSGKVAIGRVVMSSRERVVAISPRDNGMIMNVLRSPDEVRATTEYFDNIPDAVPAEEMVKIAERLIKSRSGHFDPKKYEDRYETALMEMIKSKLAGHKPAIAITAGERSNVVNLMDALKASISAAKPPAPAKSRDGAKKAGAGTTAPAVAAVARHVNKPAGKAARG